jgi:hypothetical protein
MPIHQESLSQRLAVCADYHQIYLEDALAHADEGGGDGEERVQRLDAWVAQVLSEAARERHLGVAPGVVCLLTARARTVPVEVEIVAEAPSADFAGWDRVVEASLDLPSGCLVVHGPTDYFPTAPRLSLAPGPYRVRAYFGGGETVSPDGLEGADHYKAVLWPAPLREPLTLYEREGGAVPTT